MYRKLVANHLSRIETALRFTREIEIKSTMTFPEKCREQITINFEIGPYGGYLFIYPQGSPLIHWYSVTEIYEPSFFSVVGANLYGRQPYPAKKITGRQVSVSYKTFEEMVHHTLKGIDYLKKEIRVNERLVA